MALASGDAWLGKGALLFGPPGGGKSHLAAALGLALIENGWRLMFARTTDLVEKLQVARRELALESAIAKLDRSDAIIVTYDSSWHELWTGTTQKRNIAISGNKLTLTSAPTKNADGQEIIFENVLEKVE